jgi:hypothetical protein
VKTIPRDAAFRVFHLLATIYLQLGRVVEAQSAAERVREYAEPGEQISQARQLRARVDERLAAPR